MSWSKNEVDEAIKLNLEGLTYSEISNKLNRTLKSVKVKLNRLGYTNNLNTYYITKKCKNCNKDFISQKSDNRKFCSQSCSATINNTKYPKRVKTHKCLNCGTLVSKKYCSVSCQKEFEQKLINIGIENGNNTYSPIQYKKYLISKYGNKCMECGWDKINPLTGNVPIELEHIDGNSGNNLLGNLSLLCPNCHSLTPTFRVLNMGNGRHTRMNRYKSGKSY